MKRRVKRPWPSRENAFAASIQGIRLKADSEPQGGTFPAVSRVKALSGRSHRCFRLTKVVPRETEPRPFLDEAFFF